MMKIPKKAAKKLVEEIQVNSPQYRNELLPDITKGLKSIKYQDLQILSVHIVENEKLSSKFHAKKSSLSSKSEDIAFLRVNNFEQARCLCESGVPVSSKIPAQTPNNLGNPSMGVYVSKFMDFTSPNPILRNEKCFVLILKVLKGKARQFADSESLFDPTPEYDCHVSKNSSVGLSASSQTYTSCYNASQIYLYEYNSDLLPEEYPSNILPHAIICFVYEPEAMLPNFEPEPVAVMPHQSSAQPIWASLRPLKALKIWRGEVTSKNKRELFISQGVLVSYFSRHPPMCFPDKMEVKGWISLDKISSFFADNLFEGCPAITGTPERYAPDILSYISYVQLMSEEQYSEVGNGLNSSPISNYENCFRNPLFKERGAAAVQLAVDDQGRKVWLYLLVPSRETTRIGLTNTTYNPPVIHGLLMSHHDLGPKYPHVNSSTDPKLVERVFDFASTSAGPSIRRREIKAFSEKLPASTSKMCSQVFDHSLSAYSSVTFNKSRNLAFFYSEVGPSDSDADYYSSDLPNVTEMVEKIAVNVQAAQKKTSSEELRRQQEIKLKHKMEQRLKNMAKSTPPPMPVSAPADFADPTLRLPVDSQGNVIKIKKRKADRGDSPPKTDLPEVSRSSIFAPKERKVDSYNDTYNRRNNAPRNINLDSVLSLREAPRGTMFDGKLPLNQSGLADSVKSDPLSRKRQLDSEGYDANSNRARLNPNRRESLLEDFPLPPPPVANQFPVRRGTDDRPALSPLSFAQSPSSGASSSRPSPRLDTDRRLVSPSVNDDSMDISNSPVYRDNGPASKQARLDGSLKNLARSDFAVNGMNELSGGPEPMDLDESLENASAEEASKVIPGFSEGVSINMGSKPRRSSEEDDHPQLDNNANTRFVSLIPNRPPTHSSQAPPPPPKPIGSVPQSRSSDIDLRSTVAMPDAPYCKPERPHFKVSNNDPSPRLLPGEVRPPQSESRFSSGGAPRLLPGETRLLPGEAPSRDVDYRATTGRFSLDRAHGSDHRYPIDRRGDGRFSIESPRSDDTSAYGGSSSRALDRSYDSHSDRDRSRSRYSDSGVPTPSPRYTDNRPPSRSSTGPLLPPPAPPRSAEPQRNGPTLLRNRLGELIDITDSSNYHKDNPYRPPPSYRPSDPAEMCKNLTVSFFRKRRRQMGLTKPWVEDPSSPSRFRGLPRFRRNYEPDTRKIKRMEALIERSENRAAQLQRREASQVAKPRAFARMEEDTATEMRELARKRARETDDRDVEDDQDFQDLIRTL